MSSANGTRFVNSITTDPNLIEEASVLQNIPTTSINPTGNNPSLVASTGFAYDSSAGLWKPLQLANGTDLQVDVSQDSFIKGKTAAIRRNPFLENGGDRSMDVNGSSVNQEYQFTPGSGEVWYIDSITLGYIDPGTMDYSDFGSISGGLSNGLKLEIKSNGTVFEVCNLKTNMDVLTVFDDLAYGVPSGEGGQGFMDSSDFVKGKIFFNTFVKLDDSTSDYVKFIVRDNLTGLDEMQSSINIWRAV